MYKVIEFYDFFVNESIDIKEIIPIFLKKYGITHWHSEVIL